VADKRNDLRGGWRARIFFRVELFGLFGPGDVESSPADLFAVETVEGILGVLFFLEVDECVEALHISTAHGTL